jgi:hypothetical protein
MKTLSLNILDIVQNSLRAKALEILIEINESGKEDMYRIIVEDNGKGIPADMLKDVTDPFVTSRTKRRMGLGLPLLKHHAELTGGKLEISSEEGKGTRIEASFSYTHIDRQPLGDITGVVKILVAANPQVNFIYHHTTEEGSYRFSTRETKEYLEVENLNDRELLKEIGNMIDENLSEIKVSGLYLKEKV